jgi:WD40 repeat protein
MLTNCFCHGLALHVPMTRLILVAAVLGAGLSCSGPGDIAQKPVPADRQLTLVLQSYHTHAASSLALSSNGKWLVTGSHDGSARLWEVSTGRLIRVFRGHTANVYCVALSKDGSRLATGSVDKTTRVWEVATGQEIRALHGHAMNLTSVSLSSDGTLLASASHDGTVRVWNVDAGKQIQVYHHDNLIPGGAPFQDRCWLNAMLSNDGTRLVTNSAKNPARMWETVTGKELRAFGKGSVGHLAFSGDGKWLATADGKIVHLWDMDGKELRSFQHAQHVRCVSLSSDGRWLATGAGTGGIALAPKSLRVWDTASGKEISAFGPSGFVTAMDLSADGKHVVATFLEWDISVGMWDAATGQGVGAFNRGKTIGCRNLAVSADGQWLATTNGYGSSVHLWDMTKGMQTAFLRTRFTTDPALHFSSDGKQLVAAYDGHANVWNRSGGTMVRDFTAQNEINSPAMKSDGKWLFTGGLESITLPANDKWLVTGSMRDGRARLWVAVPNGKLIGDFQQGSKWWNEVALTKDMMFLITTSPWDNSVLLWNVATGKETRMFPGHTK